MKRRGEGNWLAMALSVLLVCSLLTWPALAAVAGSGSNVTAIVTANVVLTSLLLKFVMCMVLLLL